MGWLDNLLKPAVDTANTISNAAGQVPRIINGGKVSAGQIWRKTPAAIESVGIPLVKAAADATGTVGSWSPIKPVSNFWKDQKTQTDQALDSWAASAHKELGVTGNDSLIKSAQLIPKGLGQAVELEAGGALGGAFGKLAEHLVQAGGLSKEAVGMLGSIAVDHPQLATTLAKYVTNPETDSNMFKATWDAIKNGKNMDSASALRLTRASGAAVGGSTGYNTLAGAEKGQSGKKTALTAAEGIPMGLPIEAGIDGAGMTAKLVPKVAGFLKEALSSAKPEVKAKMQDLTEHFVSDVHTPTEPTPIVHAPDTPLSEMNPGMMNAHQQAKAEQDHNLINANNLVRQAQAKQVAVHGGGLQPLPVSAEAKIAELKAKQGAYTEARTNGLTNNPAEQAVSDRNAARIEADMKAQTPPAEKPLLKNQTGSAQENQGGTPKPVVTSKQQGNQIIDEILSKPSAKPNPETASEPQVPKQRANPAPVNRKYDSEGNLTHVTHTGTGETFSPSHDGSPISKLKNEILQEQKGQAYGKNGGDIAAVHEGQAKALAHRVQDVVDHVKQTFSSEERQQLTHYAEGSLKASEVSAKVREVGDQWKELERIGYLDNKEATRTMGEIDNSSVSHVEHINLDRSSGKGKVGLGKFSTKNSTQKGRSIVKLTGVKGKTQFGDPEAMGMTKQANGSYTDKFGNTWHPSQATIKELNDNGFKYEDDAAKIMASSFNKYAKTANNLKLGRNLSDRGHGDSVIPRQPGETSPPKGYHESHIPGMENKWIANNYHRHLYTATDSRRGLVYNGVKAVGKYVAKPITVPMNQMFFAENSLYHQVVNEIGQAWTTSGLGKGQGKKWLNPFEGVSNITRTGKELSGASKSVQKHDETWFAAVRNGLHVSEHSNGGIERSLKGVAAKFKALGHVINTPGNLGAKHIGDVIRIAKYKELVDQGMSGREAARLINEVQGNYGRLNQFEKEIVTNYVQFYPFAKHQVTSLIGVGKGLITDPSKYAGAASAAALTYAGYVAIDKGIQALTGNKYAHVTKGGMLGMVDDVTKAPGQVKGYTDAGGKKHPGIVPSIVSKRLNPIERAAVEQSTGKDLATNTSFDTSTNGRLAQAGKAVTPLAQSKDISSGRRSIGEKIANVNSVYLPHGAHTPAAPNLVDTPLDGLVNVKGMNSKKTVDIATKAADMGGSKLASYQYSRLSGDNSLEKFWSQHPELDPKSPQFNGFANGASSKQITKGDAAFKAAGGSSLTYMQALKMSGDKTYDKFFASHPELDPTSPIFQGMKKSSSKSSSELSYVKTAGKNAVSKAKSLATPIKLKHTSSSTPGLKKSYSTHPKATKVSFAKVKTAAVPKLVDSKALVRKATNPRPIKLKA